MGLKKTHFDQFQNRSTGIGKNKINDPLLHSERTQGFAADPDYWKGEVFAYVGSIQTLKDLKDFVWGVNLR